MSPEIITMIAIGIAIIGTQMTTFIYMLHRMDKMSDRMDGMQKEIGEVKSEMRERLGRLEGILIGRLEIGNGTVTQAGDD